MARQGISTGTIPNDGTGDTLLSGAVKINENFSEVYGLIGDGTNAYVGIVTQIVAGSNISISTSYGSVTVNSVASGSTSYWNENSTGIHTLSNIGIGTTTASSALTVSGDVSVSGVCTATTFYGDGVELTGIVTSITAGDNISVSGSTGNVTITGLANTSNVSSSTLVVSGVSTFNGNTNFNTDIAIADNVVLNFGASSDGRISYTSGTNRFYVRTPGGSADLVLGAGPAVRITNENGLTDRAVFTGTGVTVTGTTFTNQLSVSGVSTFQNNVRLGDGDSGYPRIIMGDSSDFYIYHSSVNGNILQDVGTNGVQIWSNSLTVKDSSVTNTGLLVQPNSSTELYYNNFKKFETASNGISVTGIVTASSGIVTYYGDTSNAVDGRWILTGDGSNYTFTGIGITSGNNTDPKIYLARARVYEFVNTQPSSHPFVIRDSDGGAEWTVGVSTSTDGTNDILRFEVPMDAPNTLFYQCTVHSGMGNTITVYPTVS